MGCKRSPRADQWPVTRTFSALNRPGASNQGTWPGGASTSSPLLWNSITPSGVQKRMRFHPGDFFKEPLPNADVIVMGHILHDWNLDEKLMLLHKAYEAVPTGGAVIIHESLIDDARKTNAFGLLMSLNMLIETHGGFDYTGADCRVWMKQVGFRRTQVERLAGPDGMVIGYK